MRIWKYLEILGNLREIWNRRMNILTTWYYSPTFENKNYCQKMKQLLMALCLAVASQVSMVQSTQTIRGHIADIASGEPIIGVAVLVDSEGIGGSSDLDGNFVITNVPVGRRTIDLKTNEIVDQFTALTFPNIGYRVEF